jgi:catalase
MRTTINKGRVSYAPSSLDGHALEEAGPKAGFVSYPQEVKGTKTRERSPSFEDHYGQATLFWNSQTPVEKLHIVQALQFELSKVETRKVRQRMLGHLEKINAVLAAEVARGIGERARAAEAKSRPKTSEEISDTRDELELLAHATTPTTASGGLLRTKGLSMEKDQPKLAKGRKIAILVAPGVAIEEVAEMQSALKAASLLSEIVGPHIGEIAGENGVTEATKTFSNCSSVLFDAVYVPGGKGSIQILSDIPDARRFIDEAYKHGKPIAASSAGVELVKQTRTGELVAGADAAEQGVLLVDHPDDLAPEFIEAIAQHRFHDRPVDKIMA